MSDVRRDPGDAREWLSRARSNLARAKAQIAGSYLEDACFDAQQAAEKAIKGLCGARALVFPYTYDLAKLLGLVERAGEQIPESVLRVRKLTSYAYESRYPGATEPVTRAEYEDALAVAEAVVRWADERIAAAQGPE